MDEWLILQSFYNGLTPTSRAHIDAAAGGAFLNLTIIKATALVEKMVSNQGWNKERLQSRTKGMHMSRRPSTEAPKRKGGVQRAMNNYAQAIDAPSTCEVCGNGGHSGNDCLENP
jgi:hypothetical protein